MLDVRATILYTIDTMTDSATRSPEYVIKAVEHVSTAFIRATCTPCLLAEPEARFELATCCLRNSYSTTELLRHKKCGANAPLFCLLGKTPGNPLRSPRTARWISRESQAVGFRPTELPWHIRHPNILPQKKAPHKTPADTAPKYLYP